MPGRRRIMTNSKSEILNSKQTQNSNSPNPKIVLVFEFLILGIAVLISVIASEAKQSLATGLLRHFVPRNDTLKIESRNSVSVRDNVIIWTCLIFHDILLLYNILVKLVVFFGIFAKISLWILRSSFPPITKKKPLPGLSKGLDKPWVRPARSRSLTTPPRIRLPKLPRPKARWLF